MDDHDHICIELEAARVKVSGAPDKLTAFLGSLLPRPTGEKRGPKLSREIAEDIRRKHEEGATKHQLAEEYGVLPDTVDNIVRRVTYR